MSEETEVKNGMDVEEGSKEDVTLTETTETESSEMKEGQEGETKEDKEKEENSEAKKEEPTDTSSSTPAAKNKKKAIDKCDRPPLVRVMKGTVVIRKFKMKDAKMDHFMTILSKAESFHFEYSNGEGTITLEYSPFKDFKAYGIIHILAQFIEYAPEVEIDTTDEIKLELEAEKYNLRRQLASQQKDKQLYINDITEATTPELLRALVPDCARAIIPEDENGEKKGWAVLEFTSAKDADNTIKTVRNVTIGEDKIVAITRAEATDPDDVAKAREEFKNKPPKKTVEKPAVKKAVKIGQKVMNKQQLQNKMGKRPFNQGPGGMRPFSAPRPLLEGFGMSGRGAGHRGGMGGGMRNMPMGRGMNMRGGASGAMGGANRGGPMRNMGMESWGPDKEGQFMDFMRQTFNRMNFQGGGGGAGGGGAMNEEDYGFDSYEDEYSMGDGFYGNGGGYGNTASKRQRMMGGSGGSGGGMMGGSSLMGDNRMMGTGAMGGGAMVGGAMGGGAMGGGDIGGSGGGGGNMMRAGRFSNMGGQGRMGGGGAGRGMMMNQRQDKGGWGGRNDGNNNPRRGGGGGRPFNAWK